MSGVLMQLFVVAAVALADPQSPIAPVRVEPAGGGGNPIVISVTGVEQDPAPMVARWNAGNACLAEIPCFVSSWIEANSAASMEHLLAVRAPKERTDVERRYREPGLLARNAERFNAVRKWGLLGWADYGAVRIVFLTRDDEQSQSTIYTLPVTRVDAKWMQTDALAADTGVYEMFDRIGKAILERHRKR
jgi:hypothetical protein